MPVSRLQLHQVICNSKSFCEIAVCIYFYSYFQEICVNMFICD